MKGWDEWTSGQVGHSVQSPRVTGVGKYLGPLGLQWIVLFLGSGFYKKQTGPMSTPNSCSGPPMSMGAMSMMGRREVFCDRYSIIVLPHLPVCFWRKKKGDTIQ